MIRDFDISWSLGFPFEADSIMIVDPDAELAFDRRSGLPAGSGAALADHPEMLRSQA